MSILFFILILDSLTTNSRINTWLISP